MTNRPPPSLSKWIFVLTDILLLIGFVWVLNGILPPQKTADYVLIIFVAVCWMIGAYICIKPWLDEFRARNKHLENESLADAVEQIQKLEEVAGRIQTATASWQAAQDAATRTATAAREIEERIRANMKEFMEFTERVNSEDKKHQNLEIEKLRRGEAEWLQVVARMLDHTFMLNQAGQRSGQANLINQLSNFQNAQRDTVRRMGLVPFVPTPGEDFNPHVHQTETPDTEPPAGAVVNEILATGFTFQGQLLRRALVRVITPQSESPTESQPTEQAPSPEPESAAEAITETAPEPTPEPEPSASQPTSETAAPFEEAVHTEEAATMSEQQVEPEQQTDLQAEPEQPVEPQARRRSRKPDPQTSLPL